MHTKRIARCAALLAVVCMVGLSEATDWPQFRGPERDGKSGDTGLLNEWPEGGPAELWTANGLGSGFSQPVVVGETIYVTGLEDETGWVYVLNTDGEMLTKAAYGREWTGDRAGARTTPTVEDGRLYLITAYGRVVCMDAGTLEILWDVDTQARFGARVLRWGIAESPLVVDDKVICTPGGPQTVMVALDKATGETVWACDGVRDKSAYCSPVLIERGGRKIITTMTGSKLIGVDAETGEMLWQAGHPAQYDIQAVSPVYENGRIFITSGYGGERGEMYELSADGTAITKRWTDGTLDCHHGGVIAHEGHVYGSSDRNRRGNWICLDLATGDVVGEIRFVGKGSVAFADGMFYGYGENGQVGLSEPTPEGLRQVSMFRVTKGSGQHWAHPVIANGVLYIRHGDALMAYDVRADR